MRDHIRLTHEQETVTIRAVQLAQVRQSLATRAGCPEWDQLTARERRESTVEAGHYLEAFELLRDAEMRRRSVG